MSDDTPLMKQYKSIKEQHPDEVLFFRLGDFYEMFDSDALEISRLLNLTLTHRQDAPMCGIPFHAARNYIKRLLAFGKKIAICEQMEIPGSTKDIVKREVIQIITPATVIEQEFLESNNNNYLLCIYSGFTAYCDISTGDFCLKYLDERDRIAAVNTVIEQLKPSEILVCDDEYFLKPDFKAAIDAWGILCNKLPAAYFNVKDGFKALCELLKVKSLEAFGIKDNARILGCASAVIRYFRETARPVNTSYFNLRVIDDSSYLQIDDSSRRNLELFSNIRDGSSRYTLFDTINKTVTSAGQRLLKNWIAFPLRDIAEINFRQDWVKHLLADRDELKRTVSLLENTMDLQRLINRVALKRAIPRDLVGIKQTLAAFFALINENFTAYSSLLPQSLTMQVLSNLNALMMKIDAAINEECTGPFVSSQVILNGYDSILDGKRSLVENSDRLFAQYLEKLKAETGITNMRIVNSRVTGYVVEVTKSQISRVPDYFMRRQTLVNCERYITEELYSMQSDAENARNDAATREKQLYDEILAEVSLYIEELNDAGRFLAVLDCFCSFARCAIDYGYNCPKVVEDNVLLIEDGRHPVVEANIPPASFVPNDTLMQKERLFLITGPNMAGKSTYLRQTALIVLLAHMGSFVPAAKAEIGLTDQIFCRVGASDNLAKGESTFLVEMQEAAFILRSCTSSSLVIMDEIGRGTSTQEGMSIAYAILKYLLQKGPKTLFATHFHELALMNLSGMLPKTLSVSENVNSIVFLRKLVDGSTSSSYALHVARMAGIPTPVIREASAFQKKNFEDYGIRSNGSLFCDENGSELASEIEELRISIIKRDEIIKEIENFDLNGSTPVQALIQIEKLKEKTKCL